ncbi:aspartate kinase [Methanomassiliicoccus luminyensis]|uniref:aspartate kinase n=1 Tax=Methanomassiliicoccus luminyensis TaxID=1080712 RepID=UPI00037AF875|nr:aspartate kinase [Methanomassiliicoccus luminyensis]
MIKAMKFGGTSVGSVDALERMTSIIKNEPAKKVVVVSAMSGVTNSLIACIRDRPDTGEFVGQVRTKYASAGKILMKPDVFERYGKALDESIGGLSKALDARKKADADPVLDDLISSWGERLSTITVAHILQSRGVDGIAVSSEESGLIAEGTPGNGSANLEATYRNMKKNIIPLLEEGKTPVHTGYYGVDRKGVPMTFGRGGSDYSGSVVAFGLDANMCEIWTDVNGFMTADPRAVTGARTIDEMDYSEAAELAYFGAKVLHPRTIEPVRKKNIPLTVKNTFNPEAPGTLIRRQKSDGGDLLRSVAVKCDLSIVKIYSSEIVYQPGLISRLIGSISDAAVNTYAVSTSLSTLAVVVPTTAVDEVIRRISALNEPQIEKLTVKGNVSLICCVGDNMINMPGVAAKVFANVAEIGANIEMISEGASDVALNFAVPSEKALDAVRSIHNTFIGG